VNLLLKQKFDVIFSSKFMDKIEAAYLSVEREVVLALNLKRDRGARSNQRHFKKSHWGSKYISQIAASQVAANTIMTAARMTLPHMQRL
jgi:hypothetical protein